MEVHMTGVYELDVLIAVVVVIAALVGGHVAAFPFAMVFYNPKNCSPEIVEEDIRDSIRGMRMPLVLGFAIAVAAGVVFSLPFMYFALVISFCVIFYPTFCYATKIAHS